MRIKTITAVRKLKGRRILVRVDLNVAFKNGRVTENRPGRMAMVSEGIRWLSAQGARVILLTHWGRPNGRHLKRFELKPIAAALRRELGRSVAYNGALLGRGAEELVAGLKDGQVALLENVRFDGREEKNDRGLARELASLADLYVNDAFSVSHRRHTSVAIIQKELPSYAGPLLVREVKALSRVFDRPKKPIVLVLGGLKAETKIATIEHLAPLASHVIIGGAMASTFLLAKGFSIGASVYEAGQLITARKILRCFGNKILLPTDLRVVRRLTDRHQPRDVEIGKITRSDIIVDVGRRSSDFFIHQLALAKTIVWNGPFGICERREFCEGTNRLAQAIAHAAAPIKIVGGGDTLPVVERLKIGRYFNHLSTGGGAMLAFLAGQKLPGLESLKVN